MEIKDPIVAYIAESNLEAHSVVNWLQSNDVDAYVVEDNSGVSLFAFGRLNQFHKPKVWVAKADVEQAKQLLIQFENRKQQRQ